MNICFLTKSTLEHQIGGMEVHGNILSRCVVKSGHHIQIITTKHPNNLRQKEEDGVITHYLPQAAMSRYSRNWWRLSNEKIIQLHSKKPFDIVWAEGLAGWYYLKKLRLRLGVPIISIMQGLGILGHIRSGYKGITSFSSFCDFGFKYLPESLLVFLPLFWGVVRNSDALVAVSQQTKLSLAREFFVDPGKMHVIYNSVDTCLFRPDKQLRFLIRDKYALNPQERVIIMAGVVHSQKGMHKGLEAFAQICIKMPESKMIIVGDGPQLPKLRETAEQLGISQKVIFAGRIANRDLPAYYNAADVLMNPTLRGEGLGIVCVEALACGLPVITTASGGLKSLIEDGQSGFFVKPADAGDLADKVMALLSDKERLTDVSRKARKRAVDVFGQQRMLEAYIKLSNILMYKNGES